MDFLPTWALMAARGSQPTTVSWPSRPGPLLPTMLAPHRLMPAPPPQKTKARRLRTVPLLQQPAMPVSIRSMTGSPPQQGLIAKIRRQIGTCFGTCRSHPAGLLLQLLQLQLRSLDGHPSFPC